MPHVLTLILSLLLAALPASQRTNAQEQARVPRAWDAKTIEWQKVEPDGTKWAVLEGQSDVPGQAFTYAAFVPAGYHEHHSHGSDARVAVVQGVLKVSFGENLDLDHLRSFPVGTFLLVPANVKHTMAADVDTVIIGTAVGPWVTHHTPEHQHH